MMAAAAGSSNNAEMHISTVKGVHHEYEEVDYRHDRPVYYDRVTVKQGVGCLYIYGSIGSEFLKIQVLAFSMVQVVGVT